MGKRGEGGAPLDQSAWEAEIKVGAKLFSARKGFLYGDLNAFGGQKNQAYFLEKNKKLRNFPKKHPADCYKESVYNFWTSDGHFNVIKNLSGECLVASQIIISPEKNAMFFEKYFFPEKTFFPEKNPCGL